MQRRRLGPALRHGADQRLLDLSLNQREPLLSTERAPAHALDLGLELMKAVACCLEPT